MSSERIEGAGKYDRALELNRRHMATSAFLGLDPLYRSCDGPPMQQERPTIQGESLTDADREYSDAVTAIILGKET